MKYNKLIRDKIPDIIKEKGEYPVTHIANKGEYWTKLKEKLLEETKEYIKEENLEELADVLEVIDAICEFKEINKRDLINIQKKKAEKRGKFIDRIILDKVKE